MLLHIKFNQFYMWLNFVFFCNLGEQHYIQKTNVSHVMCNSTGLCHIMSLVSTSEWFQMCCQSTISMPINRFHANQLFPCQSTVSMPINCFHANQLFSCQSTVFMPINRFHANQLFPCQSTVSMSSFFLWKATSLKTCNILIIVQHIF